MSRLRLAAAAAFAVMAASACFVAGAALGASARYPSVCSMLTAGALVSVHVPSNCVQQKTATGSLGTVRTAVWGKNTPNGGPRLSIGIDEASSAFLNVATRSKPFGGQGRSIKIGRWSGEEGLANGKTVDSIIFVKGKYYVTINLNTGPKRPLSSSAPFITLAKEVAAGL